MRTLWISTSTLACLIPLTFLCWRNSVRLGDLRAHNGELAARMAATGWVAGNRPSDDSFRTTSHHRPDASVEAKQVAADVIAYGRGLPLPPDLPERERTRRIAEHSRRIAALDDQQLEILIAELWATPDLDEAVRSEFIGFAAECLLRTHPRKAVAILISHFEEGKDSATPHWAIREWSRFAPEEALAWVRKNEDRIPAMGLRLAEKELMNGAVIGNPAFALRLFEEFGYQPDQACCDLLDLPLTADQRLAFLPEFRKWLAGPSGKGMTAFGRDRAIQVLAFGGQQYFPRPFEETVEFIGRAGFDSGELESLFTRSFSGVVHPEETNMWVEWFNHQEPAPFAKSGKLALAQDPATAAFMAEWLLSHPDCPERTELAAACVPLAYDAKPEIAMRLVSLLPDEQDRLEALRRIHKRLSGWGSKVAAEAFAKEHGLQE